MSDFSIRQEKTLSDLTAEGDEHLEELARAAIHARGFAEDCLSVEYVRASKEAMEAAALFQNAAAPEVILRLIIANKRAARMEEVLRYLDRLGGLGYQKHEMIASALNETSKPKEKPIVCGSCGNVHRRSEECTP